MPMPIVKHPTPQRTHRFTNCFLDLLRNWGTMSSEAVSKRQALEVLQSAQEGLSVKAVLELQKMEQVSPSMKAAVAAAICMVEPLSLSRAAWPELRALVVKPGQVISALRNFSFAVDGGNVPARVVQLSKECYEASEGSPAPEEPFSGDSEDCGHIAPRVQIRSKDS
eukprot:s471_g14.t1